MSDIETTLWDIGTVTTADFAVQVNLTNQLWENWKEYKEIIALRRKKKLCFKDFLISEIESQVNKLNQKAFHKHHDHDHEESHEHEEIPKIKVACINLAYDNSHLQGLLTKRGALLVRG